MALDIFGGILLAVWVAVALVKVIKESREVPPYRPLTPPKYGPRPAPLGAPDEPGGLRSVGSKRREERTMPLRRERFRPDWYPDPDDATKVRYWGGRRWTDHVELRDPLLTPDNKTGPSLQPPGGPVAPRSKLVAVAWLTTPVLGFFLPFLGPWLSAGAAYLAVDRARPALWTAKAWPHSRGSAVTAGIAALWFPPFLGAAGLAGLFGPSALQYTPGLAGWLFIPLMGPENHLTPAAVALVVYAVGAALSAWRRRPWPWFLGGLAANVAYDLTIAVADIRFIA